MIACKKWMFYNASNHEQISHWKCISFFCKRLKKVMLPPTYKLKQPFLYSMQNPLFKTAGPSHAYTFLFWISGVKSTEKGRPALLSTTFAGLPILASNIAAKQHFFYTRSISSFMIQWWIFSVLLSVWNCTCIMPSLIFIMRPSPSVACVIRIPRRKPPSRSFFGCATGRSPATFASSSFGACSSYMNGDISRRITSQRLLVKTPADAWLWWSQ